MTHHIRLSININKIALLRNQRDIGYPDICDCAKAIIDAGANGITVHPRPDERHITRQDVYDIADLFIKENWQKHDIEFNIEGFPNDVFLALINDVRPNQTTLVPDSPEQKTSDHGWDIDKYDDFLKNIIDKLHMMQTRVSLFIDDSPDMVKKTVGIGNDHIELYTGPYAYAALYHQHEDAITNYHDAYMQALSQNITINAGHDLNLDNLGFFVKKLPKLHEVSIGHAFIHDTLYHGFHKTVRLYHHALNNMTNN